MFDFVQANNAAHAVRDKLMQDTPGDQAIDDDPAIALAQVQTVFATLLRASAADIAVELAVENPGRPLMQTLAAVVCVALHDTCKHTQGWIKPAALIAFHEFLLNMDDRRSVIESKLELSHQLVMRAVDDKIDATYKQLAELADEGDAAVPQHVFDSGVKAVVSAIREAMHDAVPEATDTELNAITMTTVITMKACLSKSDMPFDMSLVMSRDPLSQPLTELMSAAASFDPSATPPVLELFPREAIAKLETIKPIATVMMSPSSIELTAAKRLQLDIAMDRAATATLGKTTFNEIVAMKRKTTFAGWAEQQIQ